MRSRSQDTDDRIDNFMWSVFAASIVGCASGGALGGMLGTAYSVMLKMSDTHLGIFESAIFPGFFGVFFGFFLGLFLFAVVWIVSEISPTYLTDHFKFWVSCTYLLSMAIGSMFGVSMSQMLEAFPRC